MIKISTLAQSACATFDPGHRLYSDDMLSELLASHEELIARHEEAARQLRALLNGPLLDIA